MNDKEFEELLEAVKEAGQIMRGEIAPARTTTINTDNLLQDSEKNKDEDIIGE